MTKEELKKEVKDFLRQRFHLNGGGTVSCNLEKLLLDFAEPREKRNADLEQKNKDLADCNSRLLSQAAAATKRVIQQEKENADLRDNYDQFKAVAVPEIERLQKENAELKEKYKRLDNLEDFTFETYKGYGEIDVKELVRLFESRGYRLDGAYKENIKLQDQLTKATEIIKGLLSCCRNYPQENAEKIKQAEQFLKEIKE